MSHNQSIPSSGPTITLLEPPDLHQGRHSFDSVSSVGGTSTHSYQSSISSLSDNPNASSNPSTLPNGQTYIFNLSKDTTRSRRDIYIHSPSGSEILFAKMSEHNPMKPDIQFFTSSSSPSTTPLGSAKFRHGKNIKLILGNEKDKSNPQTKTEEKDLFNVSASKGKDYSFYLPSSSSSTSGTSRKVLWKRGNVVEVGKPRPARGSWALRYELVDEGSGEVLAIYDEGQEGTRDFLKRGTLVVGRGIEMGEGGEGIWVLMGAVGIAEKSRRRGGKGAGGYAGAGVVEGLGGVIGGFS